MKLLAAVLIVALGAALAAQARTPESEPVEDAALAGPAADTEARMAEALHRIHSGDVPGAQQIWRELARDARQADDAELLGRAEIALADIAFLLGHYAEVVEIHNARLTRARSSGDRQQEADSRMQLALIDRRQGRLEAARSGLEAALALFRAVGDADGEGESLTHLGLVLSNQGQFVRAIESLEASLALQRAGAKVSLDRTHHYLGLLYLGMRDYGEARGHLEQALDVARRHPDPMRASAPLGSLARLANEEGKHQEALAVAGEAATLSERFESTPGLTYSALERGRALLGLGRLDEARQALEESRTLAQMLDQDRTVADAIFSLGRADLLEGKPDQALQKFDAAVPNYEAAGDVLQLYEAYLAMVPLLREQGDLGRALTLAVASNSLLEQISGRESSRRIALIEYRQEVEASRRRIEELARQNEIKALRLERQEYGRRVGIGLILGLLLAAGVLGWLYRRSLQIGARLAASNAELRDSRREIAAANATLAEKAKALQVAATSDALTGIANRRHVLDVLDKVVTSANSHRRSVAVALIDVDRFKSVNDRFGHGVGDRVLCRIVHTVLALLPSQAELGRYGGEEFLLVLPDFDLDSAMRLAASAVAAVHDSGTDDEPQVTLSIGVAARRGGEISAVEALIEEADQALYQAKAGGRNQVVAGSKSAPMPDSWD